MSTPELSRMVKVRPLPADPVVIEANEAERADLAERFGVSAVETLRAEVSLEADKAAIHATGTLSATLQQACSVSGEAFAVTIEEPIDLRFVRESTVATSENEDGEIEVDLSGDDSDEIEHSGEAFDLGEAVAQTLGLAIDPYAEGPNAEAARKEAGLTGEDAPSGPLAEALAALKKG